MSLTHNASERLNQTTQDYFMPSLVDTVLNSNIFLTRILTQAKPWRGETFRYPLKYAKNTTGGSFSGFDVLDTTATNNFVSLAYTPKFYYKTVSLPITELSVNNTQEKVLDLADFQIATAAQDMADDMGTLAYSDGTGNSSKDFLGLGAIVDDGNTVPTIGGLSRSTYSTLASTVTASGGSLTLDKMATLYFNVTSGFQRPTAIFCTESVFALYEKLLTPMERYTKPVADIKNGLTGGTGYMELYYKGIPVFMDEKCTSGTMYMLNEKFIEFRTVPIEQAEAVNYTANKNIEGNDYDNVKGYGFHWTGWVKPINQMALVGRIVIGGELMTSNPKRHGKLTGITTA